MLCSHPLFLFLSLSLLYFHFLPLYPFTQSTGDSLVPRRRSPLIFNPVTIYPLHPLTISHLSKPLPFHLTFISPTFSCKVLQFLVYFSYSNFSLTFYICITLSSIPLRPLPLYFTQLLYSCSIPLILLSSSFCPYITTNPYYTIHYCIY